jgi:hypothetical protein
MADLGAATVTGARAKAGRRRRAATLAAAAAVCFSAGATAAGPLALAHTRGRLPDALRAPDLLTLRAADPTGEDARFGADGRDETVWSGRAGETQWRWTAAFRRPVHLGLIRAHFGQNATSGVPTAFRWEVLPPDLERACGPRADGAWLGLSAAQRAAGAGDALAQPTRRSWFVDAEACGLRLVIDRTNAGPPVVREVQAIETARDVLRDGRASDDGGYPGFHASDAIDGTYGRRWAGAPGKQRWSLRIDLADPEPIDRVRLVLGFDATSVLRPGGGRSYAVAWFPSRYTLEASEDGRRFAPVSNEVLRADGTAEPIRRRLIELPEARTIRALRLVVTAATDATGLPGPAAVPVVREIAAYRADDERPILASPWILSINANPAGQSRTTPGGELTNDAYHAKFLQSRFAELLPVLGADDRYARALGPSGEPLDAPSRDEAGEALESIEGDDPLLDAQLLTESSPAPISVLSGSNDWDYGLETGPDAAHPRRWHWDPLRDARFGGMGKLGPAVRGRAAPFVGFCGGAQLLALLEAQRSDAATPDEDLRVIDRTLRRTTGSPIRGFAPPVDVERAWPTDPRPLHAKIQFVSSDPLFADLAGPFGRSTTQALPELHSDVVRPDAFEAGGPLQRFVVLATSSFCSPDVASASPRDRFANPNGPGWCTTVTEAFRSRDGAWPVIGAQFHAEQRDFASAAPGDPPESIADPRLFLAAAFESTIDAYVRLAR